MTNHFLTPWYQNEAVAHYARLCQTLQWQNKSKDTKNLFTALTLLDTSALLNTLQAARPDMKWIHAMTHAPETQTYDFVLVDLNHQRYQKQAEFKSLLSTWRSYLNPQGVIAVFALGMYGLVEVLAKQKLAALPKLIDMHDLGDALMHTGFTEPVVEREEVLLNFTEAKVMLNQYEAMGLRFQNAQQKQLVLDELQHFQHFQFDCEVVMAHAFAAAPKTTQPHSEISLANLKAQLKSKPTGS